MRYCLIGFAFLFTLGLFLISDCPTFAQTSRKERVETIKEKVATREAKIEAGREELKEKAAVKAAALKERVKKFRNKNKAEVTERLSENLNKINDRKTNQMSKHLDKMSSLILRLEKRVSAAQDVDTTKVKTAITEAKKAVDDAKLAVQNQSEKDYTITVSSESKVKEDAKEARDLLHNDLKSVHQKVVDARKKLALAISLTAQTLEGIRSGTSK